MQVHRAQERIRAKGADVAIVGNGAPPQARAFAEAFVPGTPVYTDPSLRTYRALGFRRGVGGTFSPRALPHLARALRAGFRQGRTQGDPWQLGGVLAVRPDGTVAYRHASAEAGDHPPLDAILAAL